MFSVKDWDFLKTVLKKVEPTKTDLSRIKEITSSVEEMILKFYFGKSRNKKFLSMKKIFNTLLPEIKYKSSREKIIFHLGELNGYLKCADQISFNKDYVPNSSEDSFSTFWNNILNAKNLLLLLTPEEYLNFYEIIKMFPDNDDYSQLVESFNFLKESGLITEGLNVHLTDLGIIMKKILLESSQL